MERFRWVGNHMALGLMGLMWMIFELYSRPSSLLLGVVFIIVYDMREILRVNFSMLVFDV